MLFRSGGPQVIEVVVIDSDIKDTDKGKGEPDVTINGNKLRMAQATDGNWYGYFADRKMAIIADATTSGVSARSVNGTGLDFGKFCSPSTATTILGASFASTVGVAIARQTVGQTGADGEAATTLSTASSITTSCTTTVASARIASHLQNNVVRENKTLNAGTTTIPVGQIFTRGTFDSNFWPIIQLYNLNPTGNVVVQYNKGGGVQSTTLKLDATDDMAKLNLDKSVYGLNAKVHATITDIGLNIDPTDEDSWSFGTLSSNATTFYQLFNEDGTVAGDGKAGRSSNSPYGYITGNLTALMLEQVVLKINKDKQSSGTDILAILDNADSVIAGSGDIDTASTSSIGFGTTDGMQTITITEQAPNIGVFGTYDEDDNSVLAITSNAPRGKTATIDYNDKSLSILVGFSTATIDIKGVDAEWNSGQQIPVTVTDADQNMNSRVDEDLTVNRGDAIVPALTIGNPFTLGENGTGTNSLRAKFLDTVNISAGTRNNKGVGATTWYPSSVAVDKYSERAELSGQTGRQNVDGVVISYGKFGEIGRAHV